MKKLRILALVRDGLVPPESLENPEQKKGADWEVEYDVVSTLRDLGHEVQALGVLDDLQPIRGAIQDEAPDVVFMLLEEFHGVTVYDQAVVSYLELLRQPYTGCNPRGLLLSRDKALSKKILSYHRIQTPRFAVFPRGRAVRPGRRLEYPVMVKALTEDASIGIAQASVVRDSAALAERVRFVHEKLCSDAIAEQYIEGRELYVSVMGNERLRVLPFWEMVFDNLRSDAAPIATARVKWDPEFQKRHGISSQAARDLPAGTKERITRICKRVYRALHLSGYARIDLRLRPDGEVFVLEANANPDLAQDAELAGSAGIAEISYPALLLQIIRLGLSYKAPWMA